MTNLTEISKPEQFNPLEAARRVDLSDPNPSFARLAARPAPVKTMEEEMAEETKQIEARNALAVKNRDEARHDAMAVVMKAMARRGPMTPRQDDALALHEITEILLRVQTS